MKALLDTHALVWWFDNSPRLSKKASKFLSDESDEVLVSAVSAWEISIKERQGKLRVPKDLLEDFEITMRRQNFQTLAISVRHVWQGGQFLSGHKEPFDRLLAAQALVEGLHLISCDEKIGEFGIPILWWR